MVILFFCIGIAYVIGYVIGMGVVNPIKKSGIKFVCIAVAILPSFTASLLAGKFLVKKETVVEKYLILPMSFDKKIIVGLIEDMPSHTSFTYYTFQIKEGDKTRLVRQYLCENNILTCKENGERELEIKRSKIVRGNMWIWFFCLCRGTEIIESKAVLKEGDNFLTIPNQL